LTYIEDNIGFIFYERTKQMTQTIQNETDTKKENDKPEMFDEKIQALAKHLNLDNEDLRMIEENNDYFKFGEKEYLVLTDDEAEKKWDEHLDSYIEECLEIPEHVRFYFDEEKWKDDARMDGRGHSLSSYDGYEHEIKINETEYFIYRTN
jgi:hypothetical protein